MRRTLKTALGVILVFALLISAAPAFAQEELQPEELTAEQGTLEETATDDITTEDGASEEVTVDTSILHPEALTEYLEGVLAEHGITGDRTEDISVVFTYLATGDSWYYNADTWRYPASMYKVPMMMVLAERVANGELTQDSDIGGMTLSETEDLVLVWSNNEQAHVVRKYLGGDTEARKLYQKYSPQEESYYHSDFIDYCYFTARYMDDVMQTLYNNQGMFPNIMECLKVAMPENYFHLKLDPSYVIAQKYGTFKEFNNNTGIIFTPNPIILTVMTENMSVEGAEQLIGDVAYMFVKYTETLDSMLEEHRQKIAEAEAKAAEEARLAKEEAERKEREEAEAAARAERERLAEEQRLAEEAAKKAKLEKLKDIAIKVGIAVLVVGVAAFISARSISKKRREKELAYQREETLRRRYGLDSPDLSPDGDIYGDARFSPRRRNNDEQELTVGARGYGQRERPFRASSDEWPEFTSRKKSYDEPEAKRTRKSGSDMGGYRPKH